MPLWIVYVLILALLAVGTWMLVRLRHQLADLHSDQKNNPIWSVMQQQLDGLRSQVNLQISALTQQVNEQLHRVAEQMQASSGQIGQRLDGAARVMGELQKNLGELSQASQQIFELGKSIATLEEILRPPKMRGALGELFLGELLAQTFPPEHYALQHRFATGEVVDALLKLGQHSVPIDSKFPLDNFRRWMEAASDEDRRHTRKCFAADIRKHVDDIARKYIRPDEGTYDFSLMYIPAENVYYEAIARDEDSGDERGILSYALARRVIPVSPNSFYAYLQVILLGLKGLKIEEKAQEILKHLSGLHKEFGKFREEFDRVGAHLNNAKNKYDDARSRLEKFDAKLILVDQAEPLAAAEQEET